MRKCRKMETLKSAKNGNLEKLENGKMEKWKNELFPYVSIFSWVSIFYPCFHFLPMFLFFNEKMETRQKMETQQKMTCFYFFVKKWKRTRKMEKWRRGPKNGTLEALGIKTLDFVVTCELL